MAMTNAQRQKRYRERHKMGDLFPPVSDFVTNVTQLPVTNKSSCVTQPDGLKDCPFCGSKPVLAISYQHQDLTFYVVRCRLCGCRSPECQEPQDCVAPWNCRK